MNYEVHNWGLNVSNVEVSGVASSSIFLIGDSEEIKLTSFYDTPPESYFVGAIVPLRNPSDEEGASNENKNSSCR